MQEVRSIARLGAAAMSPPPLLVYDGDCGFCKRWVLRLRRITGERLDFAPSQQVAGRFPEVPPQEFARSIWLFEPDGRRSRAAEAACRALALNPWWRWAPWIYRFVPGARAVSERAYAFVAAHRPAFGRVDAWLTGATAVPRFDASRWLFLRLLGVVSLIAFASLWPQVLGLAGSRGIVPASAWLEQAQAALGPGAWRQVPTLLWLAPGDGLLQGLCAAGTVGSLLLVLDLAPALCCLLLYACYLSLLHAGTVFLSFQWDALLLETALLGALYAPWRWWRRRGVDPPPPALARWLLWWLLFRLMFESGAVKLSWGDPAWRDGTALTFHYWTQPLPHRLSWHAHAWPGWWHRVSLYCMYAAELAAPCAIFAPRRLRHLAAAGMAALLVLIFFTGNYGFFCPLGLALCLSLLDDDALGRLAAWPRGRAAAAPASGGACLLDGGARELPPAPPARPLPRLQRWITVPFAACVLWIGAVQACDAVRGPEAQSHGGWPARAARAVAEPLQPFALVNPYGLFRVMTRERPELIVEGSNDGLEWKAYPFRWKPGEPLQAPRWVQPHMPRLDWRMWFAALSPQGNAEWLVPFLQRLLEGEPKVLDLLSSNPFPQQPPRCVRVLLYQYRFSTPAERAATGAWWQRELQGELLRLPPAVPR